MRIRRVLGVLLAALMTIGVASAAGLVDPTAVRSSNVVIEQGVGIQQASRDRLTQAAAELNGNGRPTKFVVLANRPGGSAAGARTYAQGLRRAVGNQWTVLVLSQNPRNLSIASGLSTSQVDQIYRSRLGLLEDDPVRGTVTIANDLAAARGSSGGISPGGPGSGSANDSGGSGSGGGGGILLFLLGIPILGAGLAIVMSRRKAKRRAAQNLVEEREALEPMVDALAAQVTDLDMDVATGGERGVAAKPDADDATLAYGDAREAMDKADTPAEVAAVRATLERGLRSARRCRARLEGRSVEEADQESPLNGVCTFDPKHGRAVQTVRFQTPSGDMADVEACANCAAGIERGESPNVRTVNRGGRQVPYWQGSGVGSMIGTMAGAVILSQLLFPSSGFGYDQGGSQDSGDGGGWSDGGGGGGDFGGGGFGGGGGDFGGGGGGDF